MTDCSLLDAPSFHLRYFELLYLEHLKGEVADGIPIQARDLFVKFQAMFDNLVCGTKESVQAVDSTCQPGISEFSLWKTRARAHDTFRTKITALFRQRLRCHLEFEKSTLWYDYYFPRLDDLFDPNTMRTDQGQLVSCSSRVCLCLIPAIYSQEKTESGDGGRGERTIISKAIVIAF